MHVFYQHNYKVYRYRQINLISVFNLKQQTKIKCVLNTYGNIWLRLNIRDINVHPKAYSNLLLTFMKGFLSTWNKCFQLCAQQPSDKVNHKWTLSCKMKAEFWLGNRYVVKQVEILMMIFMILYYVNQQRLYKGKQIIVGWHLM